MNYLKTIVCTIELLISILVLPTLVYAQETSVEWINKNAYELHSDSIPTDEDLRFLSKSGAGKTIIGLGEASHGTQEFYHQKRRIVQYLVSRENYKLLALEAPATSVQPLGQYIQTGQGDLKNSLKSLGLYNSEEMYKLCEWLKSFNQGQPVPGKVNLIGFDDEAYWNDPLTRDQRMAHQFIQAHKANKSKSILWSHNLHLAKDTTMAQYKAMGFHLKQQFGDLYYAVGFDTYSGSVNVLNNGRLESHPFEGTENTFSALFRKAKFDAFFIDFHQGTSPLLYRKNAITNLYSNWRKPKPLPIVAGADFNAIVFIRNTTASKACVDTID